MKTLKQINVVIHHPNGDKWYTNAENAYRAFYFFLWKWKNATLKK